MTNKDISVEDRGRKSALAWAIFFILTIIWGSSFILMKKGLMFFSSEVVGGLRIFLTFLVLAPFTLRSFGKIQKRDWFYLLVAGITESGAPAFLFAKAQTGIDSSLAGILNSLTPLFTLIIAIMFYTFKPRWYNVFGIFLGLAGAIGLTASGGNGNFELNMHYALYIIAATICYAINVNIIKYRLNNLDPTTITTFSFLLIGIPVGIYLFAFSPFLQEYRMNPQAIRGLGYIAILAIAGTAVALILFNRLIKEGSPIFASSVTYTIPIIALIWGFLDGEKFSADFILWILLVLGGVFLVSKKKGRKKEFRSIKKL